MNPIVVVGSLNMDLVVKVNRMPLAGETIFSQDFFTAPGGKGANQAVAAARLGGEVIMIGRVGDDSYGEILVNNLSKEGINTSFVQTEKGVTTGIATITVDEAGQNSIIVTSGANMKLAPQQIEEAFNKIAAFSLIVLQLETPIRSIEKAAQIAQTRDAMVLLNPAPARELPRILFSSVDVLIPNEIEIHQITGLPVNNFEEAEIAARQLINWGVKSVVVTMGKQGVLVVEKDNPAIHVSGHEVNVVDTTAAGDAFIGGLSVGLAKGLPLIKAARFGNGAAALAVTRRGAQPSLPYQKDVEIFLDSII